MRTALRNVWRKSAHRIGTESTIGVQMADGAGRRTEATENSRTVDSQNNAMAMPKSAGTAISRLLCDRAFFALRLDTRATMNHETTIDATKEMTLPIMKTPFLVLRPYGD